MDTLTAEQLQQLFKDVEAPLRVIFVAPLPRVAENSIYMLDEQKIVLMSNKAFTALVTLMQPNIDAGSIPIISNLYGIPVRRLQASNHPENDPVDAQEGPGGA